MKIALSSSGNEREALLSLHFGRCSYFAFYDEETGEWNFEANPGARETSGAGINAAQCIIDKGVYVLLTGEVGPKAWRVLQSVPVEAFRLPEVSLKEAVKMYQEGQAQKINDAAASAHVGQAASQSSPSNKNGSYSYEPKRLALATDGEQVAQHFGRCEGYTLVDFDDGEVINKSFVPNPGHQPGFLPRFLGEKGVHGIIAGGMGPRAQQLFTEQGIDFIVGVTGSVEEVVTRYKEGGLSGGESLCEHDGHENGDCGSRC